VGVLLAGAMVVAAWVVPMSRAFGQGGTGVVTVSQHRYVVRPGDTLWSIAGRVAPGEDPRATVDSIARVNDLDPGALVPGQPLLIPSAG